jgi:two-component system osmolarity sensor histidine kinase EnvZ
VRRLTRTFNHMSSSIKGLIEERNLMMAGSPTICVPR